MTRTSAWLVAAKSWTSTKGGRVSSSSHQLSAALMNAADACATCTVRCSNVASTAVLGPRVKKKQRVPSSWPRASSSARPWSPRVGTACERRGGRSKRAARASRNAQQAKRTAGAPIVVFKVAELIVDGIGRLEPVVLISLSIVDGLQPVVVAGVHLAIGGLLAHRHRTGGGVGGLVRDVRRPLAPRPVRRGKFRAELRDVLAVVPRSRLIAWGITADRPSDGGYGSPPEHKRDHGKCQVALPWVGG